MGRSDLRAIVYNLFPLNISMEDVVGITEGDSSCQQNNGGNGATDNGTTEKVDSVPMEVTVDSNSGNAETCSKTSEPNDNTSDNPESSESLENILFSDMSKSIAEGTSNNNMPTEASYLDAMTVQTTSQSQSGSNDASSESIEVALKEDSGHVMRFRVKQRILLSKLLKSYSLNSGKSMDAFHFSYNDKVLTGSETMSSLNYVEGDFILVVSNV